MAGSPRSEAASVATALTFLCCFATGLPKAFTGSGAQSIFVSTVGTKMLPVTYIVGAALLPLVGYAYEWLSRRLPLLQVNLLTALADVAGALAVWAALAFAPGKVSAWIGIFWYQIDWVLATLVTWTLAARMLNLKEGQDYFGRIALGGLGAQGLGGLLVGPLASHLGSAQLLLASGLGSLLGVGVMLVVGRRYGHRLVETVDPLAALSSGGAATAAPTRRAWGKWRYVVLIGQSVSLYFAAEFIFFGALQRGVPDVDQMTAFVGRVAACHGFLSMAFSALTPWVIARTGMAAGLAVLPAAVGVTGLAATAVLMTQDALGMAAIVLMAVVYLSDTVVRYSIDRQVTSVLLQPLPSEERTRLQVQSESILEPAAGAVMGLLLMAILQLAGDAALRTTAVLLLVLVGVRFVLGLQAIGEFRRLLAAAVERRELLPPEVGDDPQSTAWALQRLQSSAPGCVLYSIHLLRQRHRDRLEPHLDRLARQPQAAVRRAALEAMGDAPAAHQATLRSVLDDEVDTGLAVQVAQLLDRVQTEDETVDGLDWQALMPELAPTDDRGRAKLAAVLACGPFAEQTAARQFLQALCDSPDAEDRQAAARILAAVGRPEFEGALVPLLDDREADVRQEALEAAGRLHTPRLAKVMVNHLANGHAGRTAALQLASFGEVALPPLARALDHALSGPELDLDVCRRLHHALARLRLPEAFVRLERDLVGPRLDLRHTAGRALFQQLAALAAPEHVLKTRLASEAALWATWRQWQASAATAPGLVLLRRPLAEAIAAQRHHVARLLALAQGATRYGAAADTVIEATDAAQVAIAVEFLTAPLPAALRAPVAAVLAVESGPAAPTGAHDAAEPVLAAILAASPDQCPLWLLTAAVYTTGKDRRVALQAQVVALQPVWGDLPGGTRAWSLTQLGAGQTGLG